MTYETILLDRKDHVTTVTLNRPDRLNALNMQMADELHNALAAEDQNDDTRVIIITGAGRGFCSGVDLRPGPPPAEPRSATAPGMADILFAALADIEKPLIASINGVAVGGGCTMTLLCDIRIASEAARFQLPFTRLSFCAELGSTYLLPRLIGMGRASELVLTSRMIEAREAGEIGLVNHVVPADELLKTTTEMAGSIAKLPPMAVRLNKKGLRLGVNSDLASQLRYEALATAILRETADAREAVAAFIEKRDPVFTGR
jgi:enoyl-CoA hydratase/carnithine racemase